MARHTVSQSRRMDEAFMCLTCWAEGEAERENLLTDKRGGLTFTHLLVEGKQGRERERERETERERERERKQERV